MTTVLMAILASVLMLAGLAGVFLPVLPGIPLAWLGLFLYALGTGFAAVSVTAVVVFFVLMLLVLGVDFLAPMLGAKRYQASRWGVFGAFLGLVVGIVLFGLWGVILGPFLGALLAELLAKRQPGQAMKSALGTLVGFVAGTLLKTVFVLTVIGFFIASFF